MRDNRKRTVKQGKLIQAKPSGWEIAGGAFSIIGGLIPILTGGRDIYNAYKDRQNKSYTIKNRTLNLSNASGTLERVGVGVGVEPDTYKAKVEGNIPHGVFDDNSTNTNISNNEPLSNIENSNNEPLSNIENSDKDPLQTGYRKGEGSLNLISGALNLGAGFATVFGRVAPAAVMFGVGALAAAGAGILRFLRSRKKVESPVTANTSPSVENTSSSVEDMSPSNQ